MRSQLVWAFAAVAGLSHAFPELPLLSDEQPGDLFNSVSSKYITGVLTAGNSSGSFEDVNGISTYLKYPPGNSTAIAIIYLTDIFGVQLVNNRLLGDSLAKAGYFVVMPDLFAGDPVPLNAMGATPSDFNMTAWRARHPQVIDSIVSSTIAATSSQFGATKIGAVGYCFGGKYVARFLASGKGLDAGFTAHPSGTLAEEWGNVTKPLSIAFGGLDTLNPPAARDLAETILQEINATYSTALYSGAPHGFAVRVDLTVPQNKFAQESAYFQAVRFFDMWL